MSHPTLPPFIAACQPPAEHAALSMPSAPSVQRTCIIFTVAGSSNLRRMSAKLETSRPGGMPGAPPAPVQGDSREGSTSNQRRQASSWILGRRWAPKCQSCGAAATQPSAARLVLVLSVVLTTSSPQRSTAAHLPGPRPCRVPSVPCAPGPLATCSPSSELLSASAQRPAAGQASRGAGTRMGCDPCCAG